FFILVLLGLSGGNFAMYNIWLPELYETKVRATAFAFAVSFGRFVAAGVNFLLAALIRDMGTLGVPIALTAIAFAIGLLVIPLSMETKGQKLREGVSFHLFFLGVSGSSRCRSSNSWEV